MTSVAPCRNTRSRTEAGSAPRGRRMSISRVRWLAPCERHRTHAQRRAAAPQSPSLARRTPMGHMKNTPPLQAICRIVITITSTDWTACCTFGQMSATETYCQRKPFPESFGSPVALYCDGRSRIEVSSWHLSMSTDILARFAGHPQVGECFDRLWKVNSSTARVYDRVNTGKHKSLTPMLSAIVPKPSDGKTQLQKFTISRY
jgi:hypothetical protein